MASFKLASILAAATLVAGHGYVTNATVGEKSYTLYQPYQDPYASPKPQRISRPIQGNGPVQDVTSLDLQCGGDSVNGIVGSSPAALTADPVAAGSDVELFWTTWPDSHIGPTITYMAKCPGDCADFMPNSTEVWFKVQEQGRDGTSNNWGATPLMKAGGSVKYTIPECIEPGNYLVRHEIIALHSAYSYPGAQFYPGCHQIAVTGSGSTKPSGLVAFPGAYKGSDAGITYDAYKAATYTVPGPALFSCSGSSASASSGSSSSGSTASSPSGVASGKASSAPKASSTVKASGSSAAVAGNAAVATGSSSSDESDDGCPAEETVTATITSSSASATAAASSSDDEGCDAEEPTTTAAAAAAQATATGSAAASSSDDEGCDAEEPTTTAAAAAKATATGSASASDDEGCDAEEESAYARRFHA